jgi:hypothetical protein
VTIAGRCCWIVVWSATFAAAADLPPGTILLARIKAHLRQELAALPDCSCLQTVRRDYRPARGRMQALDTIRLEVLASGGRELFASPGERSFHEGHPSDFAGSGVIGNGFFALFLQNIAANAASFQYRGEEDIDGRRYAKFDFEMPQSVSKHTISSGGIEAMVGIKGSFWADPVTFDVLQIEMHADDIPPSLPIKESVTTARYARMKLGERDLLLPVSGEYWQTKFTGEESHNKIAFTHCRLFGAESSIRFGPSDGERPSAAPIRDGVVDRVLPAGLLLTIDLANSLTNETAVGETVDGVIRTKVTDRGRVWIEPGARVLGRVRQMERHTDDGDYFVVALEFTEIESSAGRWRFFADMQDASRPEGIERSSGKDLPGVGRFVVRSRRVELPKGFRTVWRTTKLR